MSQSVNKIINSKTDQKIYDFRKNKDYKKQIEEEKKVFVQSMIVHPIFFPNKGIEQEVYLAEEAIGLAKSLSWQIVEGPFNKQLQEQSQELYQKDQQQQGSKLSQKLQKIRQEALKESLQIKMSQKEEIQIDGWTHLKSLQNQKQQQSQSNIKDGDYVYTPNFKGIFHSEHEILEIDITDSDNDKELSQWQNKLVRNKLAIASVLKIKERKSKTFFNNYIIQQLADHIKQNNINALFVNTELSPIQTKNLQKILVALINDKSVKEVYKSRNPFYNTDYDSELQTQSEHEFINENEEEKQQQQSQDDKEKTLKVFDRFTIILQIFAKRMSSKTSKLQIELAYLNFIKQKLSKGANSYSSYYNIFKNDLMMAKEIQYEVVSAKQKNIKGSLGGSGETQLELERRIITDKQSKIKKELEQEMKNKLFLREKRQQLSESKKIAQIALIGYTNSGKSQLMNCLMKKEIVESKDMLFMTLQSSQKKLMLPSGQQAILQDTVGFITDLPHELFSSFKSCLEDIYNADLILHLIDISNPFWQLQRSTVMEVMKSIGIDQSLYTNRLIEVHNKIDLLNNINNINEVIRNDDGVVTIMVSALEGINTQLLIKEMEAKVNDILGKKYYTIIHPLENHQERLKWLYYNGNIHYTENTNYFYESSKQFPQGYVQFDILLDQVTFRRYQSTFGLVQKESRGIPPQGWNNKK